MAAPTFKIERDHLCEEGSEFESRAGQLRWHGAFEHPADDLPIRFKLYDDDGILYYTGRANEDGLELAYDWSMADSGTTDLKAFENGKWSSVFG